MYSKVFFFLWCQVVFREARFDFQTLLAEQLPWGLVVFSLGGKLVGGVEGGGRTFAGFLQLDWNTTLSIRRSEKGGRRLGLSDVCVLLFPCSGKYRRCLHMGTE